MFVDEAKINVSAGRGGNGSASFLRTRSQPRGGPDGGDGGRGGDIIVVADHNSSTLLKYRSTTQWKAVDGEDGHGKKKSGKAGTDIRIIVPPGTTIRNGDVVVADLVEDGAEAIVASGGRGGLGNTHFATSTHQAPRFSEMGEDGEAYELTLELKLTADIGLVGLPNAGKSTLLSVVSAAKPKIANYPFTTLQPQLGVVSYGDTEFVMADIPGLIEGASAGKGLGTAFLRHLERTRGLLFIIDASGDDAGETYNLLMHELEIHQPNMIARPQRIVISKTVLVSPEILKLQIKSLAKAAKCKQADVLTMSAQEHQGLEDVCRACLGLVELAQIQEPDEIETVTDVSIDDVVDWYIEPDGEGRWVIKGRAALRWAQRTNMQSFQGVDRLKRILSRANVIKRLEKAGAELGKDTILIGNKEIPW